MNTKNLKDNLQDLPKWAQGEIKVLQMRLNEANKELLRIRDNPKSNTVVGSNYSLFKEPIRYLKDNQDITFVLPNGEISCIIKRDVLEVSHRSLGSDHEMFIRPVVGNTIQIHIKP